MFVGLALASLAVGAALLQRPAEATQNFVIASLAGTGAHGVPMHNPMGHNFVPTGNDAPLHIPMTHDLWEVALYEESEDEHVLYVADLTQGCAIYQLKDGRIDLFAGGSCGGQLEGADNVPALGAALTPYSVAVDANGNVFIADICAVWRVDPLQPPETRVMKRVAGISGSCSVHSPASGGPALSVDLGGIYEITAAPDGNLYLSNPTGSTGIGIWRLSPEVGGVVDGIGAETLTRIVRAVPMGLTADDNGNVYAVLTNRVYRIEDAANITVLKDLHAALDDPPAGITQVVGADGENGYLDLTPATLGKINGGFVEGSTPGIWGLSLDDAGNLYIADRNNCRIRMVTPGTDGVVDGGSDEALTTLVGSGTCLEGVTGSHMTTGDYGSASNATLKSTSYGVDVSADGNAIYLTDQHRVRVVSADSDGDTVPDAMEDFFGTSSAPAATDTDGDGFSDRPSITDNENVDAAVDSCPSVDNFDLQSLRQANNDQDSIDMDEWGLAFDVRRPYSDGAGDECDGDDDNDGLLDVVEALVPCNSATSPTDSTKADSDGDLIPDLMECVLNSDPVSSSSKPGAVTDSDSDGSPDTLEAMLHTNKYDSDTDDDGLVDGLELRVGSNPLAPDGDGDGCGDVVEVMSVNGDPMVNSIDLSQVSQHFNQNLTHPDYAPNFDVNRSGVINSQDLGLVSQHSGKSCL